MRNSAFDHDQNYPDEQLGAECVVEMLRSGTMPGMGRIDGFIFEVIGHMEAAGQAYHLDLHSMA